MTMLTSGLKWLAGKLAQEEGKNICWINLLNHGLEIAIAGAEYSQKKLAHWKHLLTASREGSYKVRILYGLNSAIQIGMMLALALAWYILGHYFFTDFKPFSYLDVNGNFWDAIPLVAGPVILYAFLNGQMDWFSSNDEDEDETIVAESLPFKCLVSISAGITEEICHRSLLIYFGLILTYLSNLFLPWFLLFLLAIYCLILLDKLELKILVAIPIMTVFLLVCYYLFRYLPENPVYQFYGLIFRFMQWVCKDSLRLVLIFGTISAAIIFISNGIKKELHGHGKSGTEMLLETILFTGWAAYCLPLSITTIAKMPILPNGSDHWTYLLYLGAVLWSNALFRDGHKYQGLLGMLGSYVIGLYMFYVCFSHGLIYAIVLHAMYNIVLFSSEHLCQVIKNYKQIACN
jgi:hypothetical protein